MSDEIEQTDQTPDATELPLEPEVSEPQAEESTQEPEPSVDEVAPELEPEVAPEADGESIAAADDSAEVVTSPELEPEKKLRSPVPWWPFWILTFFWIALCGSAAYFLTRDPSLPSLRQEAYTFVVAAGLALTLIGPLLAIVVWAFSRGGVPEERRPGMFVTSLLRAAVITFLGVVAWTGTLIFVDALRLGLIRF